MVFALPLLPPRRALNDGVHGRRRPVILYILAGVASGPRASRPPALVVVESTRGYYGFGAPHLKSTLARLCFLICSWLGLVLLASPPTSSCMTCNPRPPPLVPSVPVTRLRQLSDPPLQTLPPCCLGPCCCGAIWLAIRSTDAEHARRVRCFCSVGNDVRALRYQP